MGIMSDPEFLALLRATLAAPSDRGPAGALADWLREHNLDQLGALVAALPAWWPVVKEVLANYCEARGKDPGGFSNVLDWGNLRRLLTMGPYTKQYLDDWSEDHGFPRTNGTVRATAKLE